MGSGGSLGSRQESENGTYGKLVTGFQVVFRRRHGQLDAQNLSRGAAPPWNSAAITVRPWTATVLSVGFPDENNHVCGCFLLRDAMADTLAMRMVSAEVVFEELHGVRVPL
jgi:hypothetical protein